MLTLYKKNGFTLLEMIIVIAIAGILSAALAYTVPFISRINDTVSSRYQAQIMANVIMTRIESELRYADAVDVKTSLPETLQQGNKYVYFIGD